MPGLLLPDFHIYMYMLYCLSELHSDAVVSCPASPSLLRSCRDAAMACRTVSHTSIVMQSYSGSVPLLRSCRNAALAGGSPALMANISATHSGLGCTGAALISRCANCAGVSTADIAEKACSRGNNRMNLE